jgi:hypothetical protein
MTVLFCGKLICLQTTDASLRLDVLDAPYDLIGEEATFVQCFVTGLRGMTEARFACAKQGLLASVDVCRNVLYFDVPFLTLLGIEYLDASTARVWVKYFQVSVAIAGRSKPVTPEQDGLHFSTPSNRQRWARSPYARDNSSVPQIG